MKHKKECVHRTPFDEFRFNDHVIIGSLIGVDDCDRIGRLMQVREGCGQFGMPVYIILTAKGELRTFENVSIRHVADKHAHRAYYRSIGQIPPEIPHQPPFDECEPEEFECYIAGKYLEKGFLIKHPKQPQSESPPFIITMTKVKKEEETQ